MGISMSWYEHFSNPPHLNGREDLSNWCGYNLIKPIEGKILLGRNFLHVVLPWLWRAKRAKGYSILPVSVQNLAVIKDKGCSSWMRIHCLLDILSRKHSNRSLRSSKYFSQVA